VVAWECWIPFKGNKNPILCPRVPWKLRPRGSSNEQAKSLLGISIKVEKVFAKCVEVALEDMV